MKLSHMLAIATLIGAAIVLPAAPANASTQYTYVEDHTSSAWPVTDALPYVDKYTGSHDIYGKCRSGYYCVKIYEKTIKSYWAADTIPVDSHSTGTTYIYVNPQRNWYSYTKKVNILRHELGHAYGIWWHNPYCTDVMYGNLNCPSGALRPSYFNTADKNTLASH